MKSYLLSKSSFVKGIQCHKSLYLYYHSPELRDPVSPTQQAIFDRGHSVGRLAQQLFPGGIDLGEKYAFKYIQSLAECRELMKQDNIVIYEAPFMHSKVINLLDILVKKDAKLFAYEVKSSTSVSDTYIIDSALQYWVITNAGYLLEDFSLIYINNEYIRMGELDINGLFHIESLLDRILPLQDFISEKIDELKNIVTAANQPDIDIGAHCFAPYTCAFHGHCWGHIPKYSVMNINGLYMEKKIELIERNIFKLEDIPNGFSLNDKQRQQVDCEIEQKTIIDKPAVNAFLDDLNYPLYFMDFETINPAVPLFDSSRPYQQIPFQYSLHYLESKGAELKHTEFLAEAEEGLDPRIPFIEGLIKDLASPAGDILVYNIGFERGRLNDIADVFPQFSEQIENIVVRLKDLMLPFRERQYYTPEMKGSYSIKAVLPALVPELSYDDLEIGAGGDAGSAFESLYFETGSKKIEQVRKNLLNYCKMDTLAMVEILGVLEKYSID